MVTLSENSWWVKSHNHLCTLANQLKGNTEDYNHITKYSMNVDICKMGRRYLIWGPLSVFLYSVYYGVLGFLIFYMPIHFGFLQVSLSLFYIILGLAIFVGFVLGFILIGNKISEYLRNKEENDKEPGVVKTWYRSVKTKTCAFVRISE